jgi:hypothetical protein
VAREGHTGAGEGKRPAVIALTPFMAERLDEGLRSEIKGGGGLASRGWRSGDAGWPKATRGSGNGRPVGEEDETDSTGPLDREMRGRQPARKARIKRENVLPQIRH